MENRISKRNVALVEKCVMSTIGIKGLFDAMPDCRHTLHIFSKPSAFYKSALKTPFSAVIFSLSALRTERRTGLSSLTELAINYPHMRRLVIADDDAEARLISALSPLPLDGVISKASPLDVLQDALLHRLIAPGEQRSVQTIFGNFTRIVCSVQPSGRFCVSCRTATQCRKLPSS